MCCLAASSCFSCFRRCCEIMSLLATGGTSGVGAGRLMAPCNDEGPEWPVVELVPVLLIVEVVVQKRSDSWLLLRRA